MPSAAAAKLEKQASTEALDPIKQAIVVIEHKIRNLEKRKRKIESYREEQKNGKELNSDQLNAVSKFDEVILTLDFARDLSKQFNGISIDAAKQQKKQARKEAQERAQQEIRKVKEVLLIQDVLQNIGTESAREDFLQGRNGATQLTDEDLKFLDDIYAEVFPKRGSEEGLPPFADQVQTSAEHLLSIVDGKPKDVVGTTYNKLKELVLSIHSCGYFDQNLEEEAVEEVVAVAVPGAQEPVEEENFLVESQTVVPSNEPQTFQQSNVSPPVQAPQPVAQPAPQGVLVPEAQPPVVSQPPAPAPLMVQPPPPQMAPVPTPVAAVESSFFSTGATTFVPVQAPIPQSRPLNEVIGSVTGNFNFLQDSELDSPDLSVMLSGAPVQTGAQHVVPTPPQSNPVTVPPIPSQTFTNQNFVNVSTVAAQPKVVFQPPGDMTHHIPGFATTTPNPPPPIPMPPGHQVPGAGGQRPPPVAVHQMPPVSQPAPPPQTAAALPQHRPPPLTPAVSYGAPAPAVPAHSYAAQAQQHAAAAQLQQQQLPQQQLPQQQLSQQQLPQQQHQQQQMSQVAPQHHSHPSHHVPQQPQQIQAQPPAAQQQQQSVLQQQQQQQHHHHQQLQQQQLQQQQQQQLLHQQQPQKVQAPTTPVQPAPTQPVQAPAVPVQPQSLPSSGFAAHQPEPEPVQNEPAIVPGGDETVKEWGSIDVNLAEDWSAQPEAEVGDWSGNMVMDDCWGSSSNNQNEGYTVQGGNRNYSGRSRGPRGGRGSSNGYSGRGRGNFQNGRGGGYGYRNDDRSNNYYQNGYQRDNFSGGYKRGGRGSGGNPRGGMERGGGNSRGGMDRGGLRTGGGRGGGGNNPRGNRSGNFSRGGGGGGNKQQQQQQQ